MTRDEYEEQKRRLDDDIEAAYATFNRARDHWDELSKERRELHWQWRRQQQADALDAAAEQ